jgi:hypothetical protein
MAFPQGDNIRTEPLPVTSAEADDLAPTLPGVVVDDALRRKSCRFLAGSKGTVKSFPIEKDILKMLDFTAIGSTAQTSAGLSRIL